MTTSEKVESIASEYANSRLDPPGSVRRDSWYLDYGRAKEFLRFMFDHRMISHGGGSFPTKKVIRVVRDVIHEAVGSPPGPQKDEDRAAYDEMAARLDRAFADSLNMADEQAP